MILTYELNELYEKTGSGGCHGSDPELPLRYLQRKTGTFPVPAAFPDCYAGNCQDLLDQEEAKT
jgi:hypothetical protein